METFEITGPNGQSYEIEAPDGATQQQIMRFAQEALRRQTAGGGIDFSQPEDKIRAAIDKLPEQDKPKALRAWAKQSIARERSKGFKPLPSPARGIPIIGSYLDEAAAGVDSALNTLSMGGIGRPYNEALAFQREREAQATAANPVQGAVGQLATGIVTGGPLFSRIAPAATLLGRVGQGIGIGAGVGAVEGFGAGEGSVGNRAGRAADTAQLGAAFGAALPVAGAAASRAYGAARDHIAPTITRFRQGVEESADQILANRIARAGQTPASVRGDLASGQNNARLGSNSRATLPETIADTSDATRRLTGSLYRAGGETGDFIRTSLENRQRGMGALFSRLTDGPDGQGPRIIDATERALLIRSANSARQTERQLTQRLRQEADRLYRTARENQQPFNITPIIDAFEAEAGGHYGQIRAAMLRAVRLFRPQSGQLAPDNITRFDRAKRALDDMIERAVSQRTGTNALAQLQQFKRSLLDEVEGVANGVATRNTSYRQARETYGTNAENIEAISLGRAALKDNSEVSAEQFRELTRGQQQLFRIGFLESLRTALGTKRPGNDITQLFQQNRVRDLMREIIPRSSRGASTFANRAERFGSVIDRESRMVQTRNQTLGGSPTAQRQQDDTAFAGDALAGMWNRFRSSPSLFNMGVEAIGSGIQRVFGYRQDVALALARRLLETDPTIRNQILRRLARRQPQGMAQIAEVIDRANQTLIASTVDPALVELAD